jgi:hypothetical protein
MRHSSQKKSASPLAEEERARVSGWISLTDRTGVTFPLSLAKGEATVPALPVLFQASN